MSFSGALGRGTYQSVIYNAGARSRRAANAFAPVPPTSDRSLPDDGGGHGAARVASSLPRYYPMSQELTQLHDLHRDVLEKFAIRDKVFAPRFAEAAAAKGRFVLTPEARTDYHYQEVMLSIRRRSILLHRIRQQGRINDDAIAQAKARGDKDPREKLITADAVAYFNPSALRYAVAQRNFWQHETQRHLLPRIRWQRHPELGGVTRVSSPQFPVRSGDY